VKSDDKIVSRENFLLRIQRWRNKKIKVVFTNGCFDILHPGHIDYLEKARECGDSLVVGVNTDKSVSSIKGDSRPINNEMTRAKVLAALASVDLVTFFEEDTPLELIRESHPDVLVKGSDYEIDQIVGADEVIRNGGEVKTISLLQGFSTTAIIKKIQRLKIED